MIEVFHTTKFMNNEKPYELVAEFSHSDRGRAYHDTQTLDEPWSSERRRSTTRGDVIRVDGVAFFLVPLRNGIDGDRVYDTFGETVQIDNFDVEGFIYQEEVDSKEDQVFVLRNHNGRFLGEFVTESDALEEKRFYEDETGNFADMSIESQPVPDFLD